MTHVEAHRRCTVVLVGACVWSGGVGRLWCLDIFVQDWAAW